MFDAEIREVLVLLEGRLLPSCVLGRPDRRLAADTVHSLFFCLHALQGWVLSHFNFALRHWSHASFDRSTGTVFALLARDLRKPSSLWNLLTWLSLTSARGKSALQKEH